MQWWCSAQGTAWTWAWKAYPGVWLLVLALAAGYHLLTRNAPRSARTGVLVGWIGVVGVWLALDWPLGPLAAGYLASAHAVEFMLLAMVSAPLMLVGISAGGVARIPETGVTGRLLRVVTQPLVAAVLFNVVVLSTHVSAVVDALMTSQLGSFTIDFAWLVSALCFWWPAIVPVPARPKFSALLQILYLFLGTMFHTVIAIIMLMVDFPLYRIYELAPPMTGLTALEDLQIAGGVMEVVGLLIIFSVITYRFFRWANRVEQEEAREGMSATYLTTGALTVPNGTMPKST
jgi:putative membrane protein